jgi:hypothetical protein
MSDPLQEIKAKRLRPGDLFFVYYDEARNSALATCVSNTSSPGAPRPVREIVFLWKATRLFRQFWTDDDVLVRLCPA